MIVESDDNGRCPYRAKELGYLSDECQKKSNCNNGVCSVLAKGVRWIICPWRMLPALKLVGPLYYKPDELEDVEYVDEVKIEDSGGSPRMDFVTWLGGTDRVVGIEIQAINITGNVRKEYEYLIEHGQPPPISMVTGTNQTSITKLFGTQLVQKGSFLRGIERPFCGILQEPSMKFLEESFELEPVAPEDAELTFLSFDLDRDNHFHLVRKFPIIIGTCKTKGSLLAGLVNRYARDAQLEPFVDRVRQRADARGLYGKYVAKVQDQIWREQTEVCCCGHTRREHDVDGACISGFLPESDFDGFIPSLKAEAEEGGLIPCTCSQFTLKESEQKSA